MISFSSVWLHFFSLCVLPTTIGSESTNCDDPYQWYTMHREIKFVMIPDGSSTAPAYSLWKTLLSRPIVSPLYPSFLDSLVAFTVFLPLTGAVVPWHSRSCPISCPSSHSISMVPQARCVLRCSWGSEPTPHSGGCRKPRRDKAAGQPTLLEPGAAPVLHLWPVLACPRLGESRGCAPKVPSSSFCLCLL